MNLRLWCTSDPFPGEWTFTLRASSQLQAWRRTGEQAAMAGHRLPGMGDLDLGHKGVCLGEAGQEGYQGESPLAP